MSANELLELTPYTYETMREDAIEAGIETVAFDRSGYKFHGRVKALAEAAREGGLQF